VSQTSGPLLHDIHGSDNYKDHSASLRLLIHGLSESSVTSEDRYLLSYMVQ